MSGPASFQSEPVLYGLRLAATLIASEKVQESRDNRDKNVSKSYQPRSFVAIRMKLSSLIELVVISSAPQVIISPRECITVAPELSIEEVKAKTAEVARDPLLTSTQLS